MIITIINSNKLFIQFDKLIKMGSIFLNDENGFTKYHDITNSEFEVIDLPDKCPEKINIQIDVDKSRITKTIKIK